MDVSAHGSQNQQVVFDYKKRGKMYYPIIDMRVAYGLTSHIVDCLVDSGATVSVFRMEVAKQLHVRTSKNTRIELSGVGGDIIGYKHNIVMKIGKRLFRAPVVFSAQHTSFNILGRLGIFSKFDICFREIEKQLSFIDTKKRDRD